MTEGRSAEKGGIEVIDVANVFSDQSSVKIDEGARLRFARQILLGLAVICVGVFAGYYYNPENKGIVQIFELIKIGALPIVTLVISFYFPNSSTKS